MIEHVVNKQLGYLLLVASVGLGAGCSRDSTGIQPLPVTANVSLAPGAFSLLGGGSIAGAVEFPATDSAREYLVIGQLATGSPLSPVAFSLGGQASVVHFRLTQLASRSNVATEFHRMLRRRGAEMARAAALQGPVLRAPPVHSAPPALGSKRTFKVCSSTTCTATKNVPATAQFVGTHAAIFVDDSVPAGGFTPADLAEVGSQFDAVLYPIDTDRFGAESDLDGNGVVIVLLTRQINALVTKPGCSTAFITGYFYAGDLAPGFATQYNNGEVFYGMVPDPGSATMCAYSTSFVKRILPVTFIHEFQHMISFNQHVLLRSGNDEVLWLNEAMSHLAEELGGLHYDSLNIDSTASRFVLGNIYNAGLFLANPEAVTVVADAGNGELEERGAGWLLLRYLVDRFGPTISRTLEQTAQTGGANVQAATGTAFETLLGRWLLALYVSDLPGFSAPPELRYTSWNFRTTFASLHAQDPQDFPFAFPLRPDSGNGQSAGFSGTLGAGSGAYLRVKQVTSSPAFGLTFRGPNGGALPATGFPQLAIVRVR
jgi:hypothetical protein